MRTNKPHDPKTQKGKEERHKDMRSKTDQTAFAGSEPVRGKRQDLTPSNNSPPLQQGTLILLCRRPQSEPQTTEGPIESVTNLDPYVMTHHRWISTVSLLNRNHTTAKDLMESNKENLGEHDSDPPPRIEGMRSERPHLQRPL
ncbi:hypothetical protein Bca52824_069337 [Brassica carinata]|uniref:Uncharacterized protein n=1 Tax=Brassica carinata TaxID=52824 RepID=A0A8X7Q3K0_BRACI|nr:hypothetical protein Bca52824_069337 [Brassica carinata]